MANWSGHPSNFTLTTVSAGDSFSAGDVLLEIETDKAQMDVEAQDDGVLAKVIVSAPERNIYHKCRRTDPALERRRVKIHQSRYANCRTRRTWRRPLQALPPSRGLST